MPVAVEYLRRWAASRRTRIETPGEAAAKALDRLPVGSIQENKDRNIGLAVGAITALVVPVGSIQENKDRN